MCYKPNEFGKMIKLQEAENQIVTDYEVYDRRPNDSDLLIPAIETHQARFGRTPYLVAADAAFYSGRNEAAAKAKGVKRVCIPNRSSRPLPVQGCRRNAALGRVRSDRRQPCQHRPCHGEEVPPIGRSTSTVRITAAGSSRRLCRVDCYARS